MDINDKYSFSRQFAKISQAVNKADFEVRFSKVQDGLLRQMTDEMADVKADSGLERKVEETQKKRDSLFQRVEELAR